MSLSVSAPTVNTASVADTIELLKLIKRLEENPEYDPSEEERSLAEGFMGWGTVAKGMDLRPGGAGTAGNGAKLLETLDEMHLLTRARQATETSYFTDASIVQEVWKMVADLGFEGGRVLEPSVGSGNFIAHAPQDMKLDVTGVEMERFTYELAKLRLPNANIINSNLQDIRLRDQYFDLVIGNIPFSRNNIHDSQSPLRFNTHNYFFWRALKAVRPGGLVALITSTGTLDAQQRQREELAKTGLFVGALRLPNGAFASAKTPVASDLVVLQRPMEKKFEQVEDWLSEGQVQLVGRSFSMNDYYQRHPEHVLGELTAGKDQWGDCISVTKGRDFLGDLQRGTAALVADSQRKGIAFTPIKELPELDDLSSVVIEDEQGRMERSFHVIGGELQQILGGKPGRVEGNLGKEAAEEVKALVGIRDALHEMWQAEEDHDRTEAQLAPIRRQLNERYDTYVAEYGFLSRRQAVEMDEADDDIDDLTPEELAERKEEIAGLVRTRRRFPALQKFRQDPEYASVMALEMWDSAQQKGLKADIFKQRVNVATVAKTSADSPTEALAICLDQLHEVNLDLIGALLKVDPKAVPDALGDLIFEDPISLEWVVANEYLSGNVRERLVHARDAAATNPERFERNVKFLEPVQPKDLDPEEIVGQLGANWIAPEDIADFCRMMVPTDRETTITYEPISATWDVAGGDRRHKDAQFVWGTKDRDFYSLVQHALNNAPVKITTKQDGKVVQKVEETLQAEAKMEAIKLKFREWIWEDPARTKRLARVYNDLHNATVPRKFDGSHLSFPGMAPDIEKKLRPYQKDAVWRMVCSPSALVDHPVGAGKTFTMVAGLMTRRRFGMTQTGVITVPNHLLHQVTGDAMRLYPNAKVLMATKEDLASAEARQLFAARIATGKWDMVVMTHSAFRRLPMYPKTEHAYLEKQIEEFEAGLVAAIANGDEGSPTVKELGKRITAMQERQKALLNSPSDNGAYFEQTGIDLILGDEFHMFKNLGLPTGIEGFSLAASKRASDMHMKLDFLRERSGGQSAGFGFTGTPLTNSLSEVFVMEKMFCPEGLKERNVESFMAWVNNYANIETRFEVSVDGRTFKAKRRPYEFHNMPELALAWARFSDSLPSNILDGDKPIEHKITNVLDPSAELETYIQWLVERMDALEKKQPIAMGVNAEGEERKDNMLWIAGDGRAAAVDLSLVGLEGPHTRIEQLAKDMASNWRYGLPGNTYAVDEAPNLQFGFLDLGTPKKDGDNLYGVWRDALVAEGIPRRMIRFIHEAKTDAQRAALFEQARVGQIAVLLGSTEKMGTGMNAQDRALAVHHADATWRMDGIEQRNGRHARPKNTFPHVLTYNTVIQRTFDSFIWQTLERKARIVAQFRLGRGGPRSVQDIDDATMTVSDLKAHATGDPLLMMKSKLLPRRSRLMQGYIGHQRQMRDAYDRIDGLQYRLHDEERKAERLQEVLDNMDGKPPVFESRGTPFSTNKAIGNFLWQRSIAALAQMHKSKHIEHSEHIGNWGGCEAEMRVRAEYGSPVFSIVLRHEGLKVLDVRFPPHSRNEKNNHMIPEEVERVLSCIPELIVEAQKAAADCQKMIAELQEVASVPYEDAPLMELIDEGLQIIEEVIAMEADGTHKGKLKAEREAAAAAKDSSEAEAELPGEEDTSNQMAILEGRKRVAEILLTLQGGKDQDAEQEKDAADESIAEAAQKVRDLIDGLYVEVPFDRDEYNAVIADKQKAAAERRAAELEAEALAAATKPSRRSRRAKVDAKKEASTTGDKSAPLTTSPVQKGEQDDLFAAVDEPEVETPVDEELDPAEVASLEHEIEEVLAAASQEADKVQESLNQADSLELPDPDDDVDAVQELAEPLTREKEVARRIRSAQGKDAPTSVGLTQGLFDIEDLWVSNRRISASVKKLLKNLNVVDGRYRAVVVGASGKVVEAGLDTDRTTAFDLDVPRLQKDYANSGLSVMLLGRRGDRRVVRRADPERSIVAVVADDDIPYVPPTRRQQRAAEASQSGAAELALAGLGASTVNEDNGTTLF